MLKSERVLFILLILAYLVVASLFALRTPDWQAPDEPAHYNYVAQVAANGCCPVLEMGDWDSAYLDTMKAARFAPGTLDRLASVQYEDHQPPLYYLLESLAFRLTNGSLLALRLVSVLLGAAVVAGAYAVGRALLPDYPQIALGAAAFVAFLPQHLAMLAAVENDSLAELVVAVALWGIVAFLKNGRVKAWQLGVLVGIGLLTKVSTLFLAGLVPLAILAKWWINRGRDGVGARYIVPLRELIVFAVPALALAAVWWARNLSVYGFPDLFGLGRHNLVVVGQERTADLIAQVGAGDYLRMGAETTFNSFWGQFGWMALPMQPWMYALVWVFLGAALLGLLIGLRRPLAAAIPRDPQRAAWLILALTALLAVAQFVYYNLEFAQFQGRYMYPGLIPLGLWLALGVDGWRRLAFVGDGSSKVRPYTMWFAPAVIAAVLILLDLYVVWRVLPGLVP